MKNNIFVKDKSKIGLILLLLIFFGSLMLSFSFSINYAIELTEKVIHRTLRDHTKWTNILLGLVHIPLVTSLLLLFANFTVFGHQVIEDCRLQFTTFKNKIFCKKYLILFAGICLFFLFAFYKLIDADYLFHDDISRSHDGDRNWISFGRYISEFLSILIHSTIKLTDIAPLTQFISIGFMSCTIIILLYVLKDINKDINVLSFIPLTFIFLSPFFQECFLYRFDSPYMTLSVLFPVIPFIYKDNLKGFSFTSFICLILCCMSYQSGTSVYIMLVIYITLKKVIAGEDVKSIINFVLISIAAYAVSLVVYNALFSANTGRQDDDFYFSTKPSLAAIVPNLIQYVKHISSCCGGLLFKTLLVLSSVLFFADVVCKAKFNKAITLIIAIAFMMLAVSLSIGPYIIFEKPTLSGRVYMGINILISLILFHVFNIEGKLLATTRIIVILAIYSSVSFLYTLGNAMKEQREYNNFRYSLIISDLQTLIDEDKTPYIGFGGNIGNCNALEIAQKNYPQLSVPTMPTGGSIWNIDYAYRFNFQFEDEFFSEKPNWPLLKSTYYHEIYGKDNHFYVYLKNHKPL